MYNIIQLNDKDLSELQSIAKELGIKKTDSLKKEDLVYKILDEQAIVGATKKVAAEKANESQPRKRSRINVKKDGDKVYTATKDKAQKLEANTPQPAATAAETVKETAPVAVTPQTETVAETSTEEKTPKKRGRKPGSKKVSLVTSTFTPPKHLPISSASGKRRRLSSGLGSPSRNFQRLAGFSTVPLWKLALGAPMPMPVSSYSNERLSASACIA